MIPNFPRFKKLSLADKRNIEKFTSAYVPYSDLNFANMWAWDIHRTMRVSQLNENLVVLFNDYITKECFLSFIGKNNLPETAKELIEFSKKNFKKNILKLVPDLVANKLWLEDFVVKEDRNHHDYIYTLRHLSKMNSWPSSGASQRIRQFTKKYPQYIIKYSSIKNLEKRDYVNLFKKWAKTKGIERVFDLNEFTAFGRFIKIKTKNIEVLSLYVDNRLIGFTMYEMLPNKYSLSHFIKSDTEFHRGINDILNWEEAKRLFEKGARYHNWEQDLGLKGLRYAKQKYHPSFFIKKFVVGVD